MMIRNTNESFGDAGPFEAESVDAMVAEATGSFLRSSARDAASQPDATETEDQALARLQREFRSGLEIVE